MQAWIKRIFSQVPLSVKFYHVLCHKCTWYFLAIVEKLTHTTLFDVNMASLKNIRTVLGIFTQAWRWLTNVTIPTLFTDGTYSRVKWSRNQTMAKTILAWQKRNENVLRLSLMSLFKIKKCCSLSNRQLDVMIKNTY